MRTRKGRLSSQNGCLRHNDTPACSNLTVTDMLPLQFLAQPAEIPLGFTTHTVWHRLCSYPLTNRVTCFVGHPLRCRNRKENRMKRLLSIALLGLMGAGTLIGCEASAKV